jgi:hypothetical protein
MFEDPPEPGIFLREPMAVTITARLNRTRRQKCTTCGRRRVCFYISLSGIAASPIVCAQDAGLR